MSMYYVTDPDGVVANIQTLLDQSEQKINIPNNTSPPEKALPIDASPTREHTLDTREKIRDVLR